MSADQLLTALFNAGIVISVGATVLSLGMTFTVGQLLAPLRRGGVVLGVGVLYALVVPAIAWGVAEGLPINDAYGGGGGVFPLGARPGPRPQASPLARKAT